MIGAGHMLDLVHKVKQNLSMLPSRRSKFKEHGKKSFSVAPENAPVNHKYISEERLYIILSEIKNKAFKEKTIDIDCFRTFFIATFSSDRTFFPSKFIPDTTLD